MIITEKILKEVWQKTAQMQSQENEIQGFRKDQCSAWIKWSDYGNRDSIFGREVDHIVPIAKGGPDHISNLRALHWKNNLEKNDGELKCPVQSHGLTNIGV